MEDTVRPQVAMSGHGQLVGEDHARQVREGWVNLLSPISWSIFASLTFRYADVSVAKGWRTFHRWRSQAERRVNHRRPVSWYACPEYQQRDALHFHALLTGIDSHQHSALQRLWHGNAEVEPFDPARAMAGITYVTKDVLIGAEPGYGGPLFGGRRPSARPRKHDVRDRDQKVITFMVTAAERQLVDTAITLIRQVSTSTGAPIPKPGVCLEWVALEFLAGADLERDDRIGWHLRLIEHVFDVGAAIVRLPPSEHAPEIVDRLPLRFPLFKKDDRSQWHVVLLALHRAQQLWPGMTREAALGWLCIDLLITWSQSRTLPAAARPTATFLLRHLARINAGAPVAARRGTGEIILP